MKHTLETYPARQYSTKNRKRRTRLKRWFLILAACVLFWGAVAALILTR